MDLQCRNGIRANFTDPTLGKPSYVALFGESTARLAASCNCPAPCFSKLKYFFAAIAVALGSWLSGFFILVTNAFMQHPAGYRVGLDGSLEIASKKQIITQPGTLEFAKYVIAFTTPRQRVDVGRSEILPYALANLADV
jgi:hypothetical protein